MQHLFTNWNQVLKRNEKNQRGQWYQLICRRKRGHSEISR
ncbi:unnamed protein product [Callosobruchus maculatus]|uniref:Uncharacterized protein n=1 Tax=Callosobruchus maculatus TaxID=64391 RepID=A0A653BQ88_CALMS|nr:unnamed protein product [Callosobruchus maculatus]